MTCPDMERCTSRTRRLSGDANITILAQVDLSVTLNTEYYIMLNMYLYFNSDALPAERL